MTGRSRSIDPLAQAQPAKVIKIVEVVDRDTGEILVVRDYIRSHRYQDIFGPRQEARSRWATENPKFLCADCLVPVSLLAGTDRNWFFFRHLVEDGSCPAKTRGKLNQKQINAIRYHAQRESEAHILFKERLAACLEADARFSSPIVEKRWTSSRDPKRWKKPDVRSSFGAIDIAFEVQLSTTFLDVVLDRRAFYKEQNAALVWLLPNFDPAHSRMTEDDVLFSNNKNVFVLDAEAIEISLQRKALHFRGWFRRPFADDLSLGGRWDTAIVDFADIQIDIDRQSAYYFDYDNAEKAILDEIEAEAIRLQREADERDNLIKQRKVAELRSDFEFYWHGASRFEPPEDIDWERLHRKLQSHCPSFPYELHSDSKMSAFLNGSYSAATGSPVGWNFDNLVKVGHHLADQYPTFLAFFGFVCKAYGSSKALKSQDTTRNFYRKVTALNRLSLEEKQYFQLGATVSPIAAFLFPDAWERFSTWLELD